jgi:hypothetical protein
MRYYIPFIGIVHYLNTFDSYGYKYGVKECLFGFFMAFYHATWVGIPIGLILSQILN